MRDETPSQELEQTIRAAMDAPGPSSAFLAELGEKLDAQARGIVEGAGDLRNQDRRQPRFGLFRQPLWKIALTFLLVAVLAILAIGPQRVLAQVQSWLRYTGWFGFVEPDQTLVLSSPVRRERNGLVITVTEAIATPERVAIRLTSRTTEGLPVELALPLSSMKLRLPDGRELRAQMEATREGEGIFGFPGLPPGVDRVTLVIPPKPADKSGLPWELPLPLEPASRSRVDASWPAAYLPDSGGASANSVTMEVLAVVQTDQVTALQAKFSGDWVNE